MNLIRILNGCKQYAYANKFSIFLHSYEFCKWKHENGEICMFEWKRAHDAVKMQDCGTYINRMKFIGNYNKHECKIKIRGVTKMDQGKWTCQLESYVWGPARGSENTASLNLRVLEKPTTRQKIADTTAPITEATKALKRKYVF